MSKFDDVRTWFYFPIEMPVDKNGYGPVTQGPIYGVVYEVWDRENTVHASFAFLSDAINYAIARNLAEQRWERPY